MEQWFNNKLLEERDVSLAESIIVLKIANLQSQVASLTSAVADTSQGSAIKC
jgi:hypothetical protein